MSDFYPFKRQTHKMVKLTQNNSSSNCRRIVRVCLTILWGWRLKRYGELCFVLDIVA